MFDLEEQVQRWRRSLAGSLPVSDETIDELESHLREAVESMMLAGQSPQAAWETALAQLGTPEQLAAEFRKLPSVAFYRWLPAQVLLVVNGAFAVLMVWFVFFKLAGKTRHDPLLAFHVCSLVVGYTAVFAIGGLAAGLIIARAVSGWTERQSAALCSAVRWWTGTGMALTLLGIVLGSFWARDHMGRFWGWDFREIGALSVLLWNAAVLGLLAWRPRNERLMMLLCQAGNLLVVCCWFGPGGVFAALVLIEMALAGLALVRPGQLRLSRG